MFPSVLISNLVFAERKDRNNGNDAYDSRYVDVLEIS